MIVTPTRRIWLCPAPDGALEILILGDDEGVAAMFAQVRRLVESWRGFDRVSAIVQSGAVLGLRATLSPLATYREPAREAMRAVASVSALDAVSWDRHDENGPNGVIGRW